MTVLVWVLIGTLSGWMACIIMGTSKQKVLFVNLAVGIAGAVLGGWLSGDGSSDAQPPESFRVGGLVIVFLCALASLTLARLARVTG